MSNWSKFRILLWKNWILQIRHKKKTTAEILIPMIVIIGIALYRRFSSYQIYPEKTYPPFKPFNASIFHHINQIAYAPNTEEVNKVMDKVKTDLKPSNIEIISFKTTSACEKYLHKKNDMKKIGVIFNLSGKRMSYTLRFPSELHIHPEGNYQISSWETNENLKTSKLRRLREPTTKTTPNPSYYAEGFLTLQYSISKSLIESLNGTEIKDEIKMQRFPLSKYKADKLARALRYLMGLMMSITFSYSASRMMQLVAFERRHKIKESLGVMGVPSYIYWGAFFVKSLMFLSIVNGILVVFLASIYPKCDVVIMVMFLLLYTSATISLCCFVGVVFTTVDENRTAGELVFILLTAPYLMLQVTPNQTPESVKMIVSFFPNCAMSYGFEIISLFEENMKGISWQNFGYTISFFNNVDLSFVFLFLLIDTILYMLMAVYAEEILSPKNRLEKRWWPWRRIKRERMDSDGLESTSTVYYQEISGEEPYILVRDLNKYVGKKKSLLRKITLNMYRSHVTVLVNHKGSETDMLIAILVGLHYPSTGSVLIDGCEMPGEVKNLRDQIGYSPRQNIVHEELTVTEHIYFYSALKNNNWYDIRQDINNVVLSLDLREQRHVPVRFLNSIEKRKLSVALSLCGKPTFVVLDEPMIGLDSEARFQLWQFIAKEKKGKAVIVTDPYLEEAEVFADRILILQNGMVECWGPPKYINEKYLSGYRLILGIENAENIEKINDAVKEFIPTAKVIVEKGDEVQFLLGMDTSNFFDLFNKLEEEGEDMGIFSFTLNYICLELLIIRSQSPEKTTVSAMSVHHPTVKRRSDNSSRRIIMRNCLRALIKKRVLCTFRTFHLTIMEFLIPLIIFWVAFEMDITRDLSDLPSKKLSLETCEPNSIAIINDISQTKYHKNIKTFVNGKAKLEFVSNQSVESLVLKMHHPYLKVWYVFGADITDNRIVASFNGDLYHSAPVALNFAMNYVLKKNYPTHLIEVSLYPLPPVQRTKEYFNKKDEIGHLLAMLTSIWMSLIFAFLMAFYVKPLQSQKEYLRILSGASANMLFGIHIVFNFVIYVGFVLVVIMVVVGCWHHYYSVRYILCLGCIFLVYGFHMLPVLYLLSFWTNSETGAFILTLSVCSLTGFFIYIVEQLIERAFQIPVLIYNTPLSLLPNYNLCRSVHASSAEFWKHRSCSKFVITCVNVYAKTKKDCESSLCSDFKECCNSQDKYFSLEHNTVLVNVICAIATSIILTAILFFIEHNTFRNLANLFKKRKVYNDRVTSCIYEVVESPTRNPLNTLPRLLTKDLCYKIGNVDIIKNISFEVFPGECLGLVGTDDLGRAAILKIIVGQAAPSEGKVIINDLSFDEENKSHTVMGYCPSDPCFVKALSMRNNLRLACIIKGIVDFRTVIANLAHDLDFEKSLDIKVKNLNHLDVQKLNLAIALIDEPDLLILDEFTLSLDPKPKHRIWQLLKEKITRGMSVIITTSSMEECNFLCDKITLIVNGRIRSKGGMVHLRDTYSQGHILIVTLPYNISTNDMHFKTDIEDRISSIFRYSKLIHTYDRNIVHLIATTQPWTSVLEELEQMKEEFGLDTYRICPSSFDLVYILLTRQQTLQVRM